MLFNSLEFLLFLPLVFVLYWSVRQHLRVQNALVLIASYVFYGYWDWRFLGLLAISSLGDYLIGMIMERTVGESKRKWLLALSMAINLGILGYFKYANFFIHEAIQLLSSVGFEANPWSLQVILPVGISFYTFQTMSYTIDVYKRQMPACTDFLSFFAYVSFFPQLVAGPIERAQRLIPQFLEPRTFRYDQFRNGMRWILWGLFKKVVIADNCAPVVDQIFSQYETLSALNLLMGAVLFAFQIYGDFSGYSDIAIGTAALFGFELMTNFKTPYFSRDIAEFWRRWHISLSTWFRDYLYIPLGGSRGGMRKNIRNVFIIFLVSGFWHGANWTFIAWGGLNALYFLPSMLLKRNRRFTDEISPHRLLPEARTFLRITSTFLLSCLAWVFFRAPSIDVAANYLIGCFTMSGTMHKITFDLEPAYWFLLLAFIVVEWATRNQGFAHWARQLKYRTVRWFIYSLILSIIALYGSFEKTSFIYFQF
jgi:D-alanyl-lipoteichoic acid acyltransferase DltB (MBOAT superfamily)